MEFLSNIIGSSADVFLLAYFVNGYQKKYHKFLEYSYCLLIIAIAVIVNVQAGEQWYRMPIHIALYFIYIFFFTYNGGIVNTIKILLVYLLILGISELLVLGCMLLITGDYQLELLEAEGVVFYFVAMCAKMITYVILHRFRYTEKSSMRSNCTVQTVMVYITIFTTLILLLIITRNMVYLHTLDYEGFVITLLLVGGMIMLSTVCYISFLDYFVITKDKEKEIQFLEQKNKQQYELYKQKMAYKQDTVAMQHDMNKNISYLLHCLQHDKRQQGIEYATSLIDQLHVHDHGYMIATGNDMMDYLLMDLQKKCDEIHAKLQIDIRTDLITEMDDYDLIALFGNLFENAYEAVAQITREDDRYMEIKIKRKDSFYVIKISNRIASKNRSNATRLLTWKEDKAGHGIGMKNVKKVVEKYEGTIETFVEDGMFTSVVLIAAERDHSGI